MKINMTIGKTIGIGFAAFAVLFLIINYFSLSVIKENQELNRRDSEIYVPSINLLIEFNKILTSSEILAGNSVNFQNTNNESYKDRLREKSQKYYPELRNKLEDVYVKWDQEQQNKLDKIFYLSDELFMVYSFVLNKLEDIEIDDDVELTSEIIPLIEPGGKITDNTSLIVEKLDELTGIHQNNLKEGRVEAKQLSDNYTRRNFIMIIVLLAGGFVIATLSVKHISRPLGSLRRVLNYLSHGKLPDNDTIKHTNNYEIKQMVEATKKLVDGLKEKTSFAKDIGQGNFESDYKPQTNEDILGVSLIEMRDSLRAAAEEEKKRQVEDKKRNWTTQGIAKFSELLRQNNDNLQELSFRLIKNMVNYLDANQGGLFILSDEKENEEQFVELIACYAYKRKKYRKKKIFKGEGLVGTCLQEGETIFISDVPDNYIEITSGLGDSNPRSILIVPLKLNDEIYGVVEIASFNVFETYQIKFVEKIGESIASTISSVKINIHTNDLLKQSQEQSEEMRAQEEEMRQNMEEMNATQEEMERKEAENQEFYTTINSITGIIYISLEGIIKSVNQTFSDITGYDEQELIGKDHKVLFDKKFTQNTIYKKLWEDVNNGQQITSEFKLINSNNEVIKVNGTFGAIRDKFGTITKLIFVVTNY